ncbi:MULTISPECIES: DUF2790 domain-containing protein [unclassified Pseudomonas]|uniref:DUF2790 domain-containing protein n=1 Tax=unclassified Pseudomonas TaxID=196821 RepID=UPI000EAA8209|nr:MULTISPECIES: DUF2790 domain-containing protein [unclassified Pseudomonas]AYF90010.1 DUF2790 domain-containing protein [Pseudomonas sp. DY-1]MDH4652078.1 DUF2790 domain-containing protein [Pseudomonas sp. BN606]MRK22548.1 DUF2790 domain-containing protein [Pseudomonas sp. JG-B]
MKATLIALAGGLLSTQIVVAAELGPTSTLNAADKGGKYHYGMDLDIAQVLSHSEIPNVCKVVPAEMTYVDSEGEHHTLQYKVMGTGCHG